MIKFLNSVLGRTTLAATAAAALLMATPLHASITIDVFTGTTASDYLANFNASPNVGEDFEALGVANGVKEFDAGLNTAVGLFEAIGGVGTGGTVGQFSPNDGEGVALRNGNVFGRTNNVPDNGNWFLDSNDTFGVQWTAQLLGGKAFTKLWFVLQDAGDQGAWVTVNSGSDSAAVNTAPGNTNNGNAKLVEITFNTAVTSAMILIENFQNDTLGSNRTNDGFGIDGAQISAVPLPAGIVLLSLGLAGVGAMRAMQKRRHV